MRANAARSALGALVAAVPLVVACGNESVPAAAAQGAVVAGLAAGGDRSYADFSHTCAIVADTVQCWGANTAGQLGDGFVNRRNPLPTRVRDLGPSVTAIAAGGAHTCAVESGKVRCWGRNDRRQLGAATPAASAVPLTVAGLPAGVTLVAAGGEHTCAIAGDDLWCWGLGTRGQLGVEPDERCGGYRASERCSAVPSPVRTLPAPVSAVALGRAHSCALAGSAVHCWGSNERGQLGDRENRDRATPRAVAGLGAATALAAGAAHTCALADGSVFCWGANGHGQLGDGETRDRSEPRAVAGLEGRVEALTAGAFHTCALHEDQLSCWGANGAGQLGRSGADVSRPAHIEGLAAAGPFAAGADHTCVGRTDGRLVCFGDNAFGQLGDGRVTSARAQPGEIAPVAAWDRGGVRDRNGDGTLTVGCIGDSNTELGFSFTRTWCERLGDLLGAPRYATVNRGWSGATAIFAPSLRRAEDPLDYALAFDELDAVILAFGTNDLLQRATPEDIVLAYLRHLLRAREFGVESFVALIPPMQGRFADQLPAIRATNQLLRASIPPGRVIDFFSGVTPADFSDEIHLNEAGQDRRARAALAVLRPGDS